MFIFTKIPQIIDKIAILKTLFWSYFMKAMPSGSVKLIVQLNRPTITDTAKM